MLSFKSLGVLFNLILYNVIEKMSPYDSPMSYSWMSEKIESNLTLNSLSKSKNIYLSKASKIIQSATTLMESTLYIGHSRYGFPNTNSKWYGPIIWRYGFVLPDIEICKVSFLTGSRCQFRGVCQAMTQT